MDHLGLSFKANNIIGNRNAKMKEAVDFFSMHKFRGF